MVALVVPFQVVEVKGAEAGTFEGYGSTFGNVDLGKDVCARGCFSKTLAEAKRTNTAPAMYWMHDKCLPIGDWLDLKEDDTGLRVKGRLWIGKGIPEAERAYCMLQGTGPKGLSIGYVTKASRYDAKTGIRSLDEVELPELSVVGYGMNPNALVDSVKAAIADGNIPTIRDIEEILRDAGLSAKQSKALLSNGYAGLRRDGARNENQATEAEDIAQLMRLRRVLRGEEPCG